MNIETAFNAIKEWYGEEDHYVNGVVEKCPGRATEERCDQSESFREVRSWQESVGDSGDSWRGEVYFQLENGKWISTSYF